MSGERVGADPEGASGPAVRIGVDIGGTFTDLVVARGGPDDATLDTLKLLSTPDDPARAVLDGVARVLGDADPAAADGSDADAPADEPDAAARPRPDVVHGSTVATNAVLERRGARTAFVATRGFRDLLAIARQQRPELYDLFADPLPPLVPSELAFGVEERVDRRGRVLRPLEEEGLDELIERLEDADVESVAVCFLFSYLRPEHEERVTEALRTAGFRVSASHEVLPEFREYERASTTAMNAYVTPLLDRYLERLSDQLPARSLRVMQSSGGSMGVDAARRQGVRSILSGPAGGVVGALEVARAAGYERIVTFDMGGTSTDVSLAEGAPEVTTEATVGGLPVAVPVVDLHTVGSGGGSVARVDAGGALRVGPESAGADPGPVCYGRGGERPTVTDAHLVLGRLDPGRFLGGEMELEVDAARAALEALGREASLPDPGGLGPARAAALGVVRVANVRMQRALRVISIERGHDPADFVLVSFGGAGGLHACDLARELGIGTVLVPPAASTLSAYGLLAGDVVRDHGRTVMLDGEVGADELEDRFRPLVEAAREEVAEEGVPPERITVERELEMRYRGQSYELRVEWGGDFLARFHRRHRDVYGHAEPGSPVEIVTLRARGVGRVDAPSLPRGEPTAPDPAEARLGAREVVLPAAPGARTGTEGEGAEGPGEAGEASRRSVPALREVPFYRAAALRPGHRIDGPAVVVRDDTTIVLGEPDRAEVDGRFNLLVEVGP